MNFVKSLDLLHVSAKEIPCLTGPGAPTVQTEGAPGVLYMDTDTGALYKCRSAAKGVHHWEGADFFTEEDKAGIVAAVIAELGGYPVFGTADEDNNILISGALPYGTYYVRYESETTAPAVAGKLVLSEPLPYTNQIPISIDANGKFISGVNGEIGYISNCKLVMGTGDEGYHVDSETTGFIPVKKDSVIRIKNIAYEGDMNRVVIGYDANFVKLTTTSTGVTVWKVFDDQGTDEGNGVRRSPVLSSFAHFASDDLKYIRLSSADINENSILTVDEEIV